VVRRGIPMGSLVRERRCCWVSVPIVDEELVFLNLVGAGDVLSLWGLLLRTVFSLRELLLRTVFSLRELLLRKRDIPDIPTREIQWLKAYS